MAIYNEDSNQHSDGRDSEVSIGISEAQAKKENNLIDSVIEQIKEDIDHGDVSAVFELLRFCPVVNLITYLPEERWGEFTNL